MQVAVSQTAATSSNYYYYNSGGKLEGGGCREKRGKKLTFKN
jgi:hypothetical protein